MKSKLRDPINQFWLKKHFQIVRISVFFLLVSMLPQVYASGGKNSANPDAGVPQQQLRTVSGTIKDINGEPLVGVTVVVTGFTTGTNSDIDGKFRLDIPAKAQVLVFSFIGMKTQEVPIGDKTVFDIVMAEDIANLDEVVVVGYGTMKRRELSGHHRRSEVQI